MIHEKLQEYKLIPLHNNNKIPSVSWGTDETIMFDDSETGYGVDTGRSKLVVIDCDNKNDGVNGIENFLDISRDFEESGFPDTFSVETPNNGLHLYFKIPQGTKIKSSVSKLAPGIDVRAEGGYIVAPGSKIVDIEGNIKEYKVMDNSPIAELPLWLMKKLEPIEQKLKNNSSNVSSTTNAISASEEIEQQNALNWALDKIGNAKEGERNNVLNHVSYFIGMKKVPLDEANSLITEAIRIGLPAQEAQNTFNKAYEKGLKEENTAFEAIVKEYNTKTGTSFKDDPMDTEFYSHLSLSYNLWLKYRNNMLFWEVDTSWYSYNDSLGIWEKVKEEEMRGLVKDYLEKLVIDIRASKVNKIPASVYRAQEKLWTKVTVDSVIVFAKSDFLNQEKDLFDSKLHLINVKNGVLNLKTGEIHKHSKEYYMTKHIPYNVDLNKTNEYCDKVLECIHPEEREYLQLFAGQSLTGYQPNLQVIPFLFGRGSNGKSTFIDLMLRTSGAYGKLQPPSILQASDGRENYALADFNGLRNVIVEELPDSKQLNSGSLKRLVGTEKINARPIYGAHREFINQSTMFVSCNRLPMVNETDDGTWRRLLVFTFPYSYKKNSADIKNEFDKLGNPMVLFAARKNPETAEAFLAWRIKGAMKWFENINAERKVPETVQKTVTAWNENNDLFLAWFNDNIEQKTSSFILLQDAFDSFNSWATKRGNSPVSLRYFISNFTNHKTFFDNKVEYKSKSGVLKQYTQSLWTNTYDKDNVRIAGVKESYFLNIGFQS